jgi:hypothetical protein
VLPALAAATTDLLTAVMFQKLRNTAKLASPLKTAGNEFETGSFRHAYLIYPEHVKYSLPV